MKVHLEHLKFLQHSIPLLCNTQIYRNLMDNFCSSWGDKILKCSRCSSSFFIYSIVPWQILATPWQISNTFHRDRMNVPKVHILEFALWSVLPLDWLYNQFCRGCGDDDDCSLLLVFPLVVCCWLVQCLFVQGIITPCAVFVQLAIGRESVWQFIRR